MATEHAFWGGWVSKTRRAAAAVFMLTALLAGCTQSSAYSRAHNVLPVRYPPFPPRALLRGLIYTEVVTPLTWDMNDTPLGGEGSKSGSYYVSVPATRLQLSAEWNSRAIGDAMRNGELRCALHADRRVFSVLGGLFKKESVKVWGRREGCSAPQDGEGGTSP